MTTSEFENIWHERIETEILKDFPDEFIKDSEVNLIELPGKPLMKGSELFGSYEVIDTDGNPVITCNSIKKMKYVLYANRNKPQNVSLPKSDDAIFLAVKNFENHLDEIIRMIKQDYKNEFPESDKFVNISNKIFQRLNLRRF